MVRYVVINNNDTQLIEFVCFAVVAKLRQRRIKELDAAYRAACSGNPEDDPDLCYFLGDEPSYSKTWSMTSGKVPTFRLWLFKEFFGCTHTFNKVYRNYFAVGNAL